MKKTNENLRKLVQEIKEHAGKNNSAFWRRISRELEKPTRRMRKVNLYKINRSAKTNETVVVPGVVLGIGELDHDVNVAAFRFSDAAAKKIKNKMTIKELLSKNPTGKDVRILG